MSGSLRERSSGSCSSSPTVSGRVRSHRATAGVPRGSRVMTAVLGEAEPQRNRVARSTCAAHSSSCSIVCSMKSHRCGATTRARVSRAMSWVGMKTESGSKASMSASLRIVLCRTLM